MAIINGTAGNDTIRTAAAGGSLGGLPNATDEGDTISGFGGNDLIVAGSGNDVIDGGPGNDTIYGNDGDDQIDGGEGSDWLYGGAGNDTLNTGAILTGTEYLFGEAGDDTLIAGVNRDDFFVHLFGGAGNDTIRVTPGGAQAATIADYADRSLPIAADLAAGTVTVALGGGLVEVDTLVDVRAVRGGIGNDTLFGSAGDDMLLPGLGTNVIDGRGGFDSLRYMDIVGGVDVDMALGTAFKRGDGSTDTFSNIEGVVGTVDDDTLFGDDADNNLRPLAGNDVIDGRGGYDTIQYSTNFSGRPFNFSPVGNFPFTAGIVANLTTGIIIDPWGGTDRVSNIERVVGTRLADDLTGAVLPDGTRTQLRGLQGNDIFRAPAPDTNVTVDYRGDPAGVRVNLSDSQRTVGGVTLAPRTARDGYGDTDSFVNIQAVRGSHNNDAMIGSARADVLEGEGGDDVLDGAGGDDTLNGGAGRDTLIGGDGNDTLIGGGGDDVIIGGEGLDAGFGGDGNDTIWVSGDEFVESWSGGPGRDRFLIERAARGAAADIVVDFAGGNEGDWVDLSEVVRILVETGEIAPGLNPFATGHLRLKQGSAILQVDWDGPNGSGVFADLLVMQGVQPGDLGPANFGGYDPAAAAPAALGDSFDGVEDTPLVVPGPGVLANDIDPNDDPLTAVLVAGPSNGTLSLGPTGGFTYTPAADFFGVDSFTYRATDGVADSNVATVTITVSPVNDAPVAVPDAFLGEEDVPLSGDLALNDVDVDGDSLTYSVVGTAPAGLVLNADGTFTYTPPPHFNGIVGFTYRAEDGKGGAALADVVLTLAAVNDPPEDLVLSDTTVTENSALGTVIGLLSATDIHGDPLTFSIVGTGPFAIVGNEVRVNGVIDFETSPTLPLTVRATDPSGASVTRDFVITVRDVVETNPAPGFAFSNGSQGLGQQPSGAGQGVGGLVQAGVTQAYGTLIELVGVWNSVKNAVTSVDGWSPGLGQKITVANFVDTRLDLDNAGPVGLDVTLVGVKRGEVFTAAGNDSISVVFHSNEGAWNNTLRVGSGAGDDVITATTVARSLLDDALLADNANPANGPLWNRNYDGRFSVLHVDLGEGNDTVTAMDVRLVANGGAGNDSLGWRQAQRPADGGRR